MGGDESKEQFFRLVYPLYIYNTMFGLNINQPNPNSEYNPKAKPTCTCPCTILFSLENIAGIVAVGFSVFQVHHHILPRANCLDHKINR